ncbi:hypothetical protein OG21DRAFT_1553074, partial [Imleria badia]
RDAVDIIPHAHPVKPTCLNNLGDALLTRFKCIGELSDLEDAITRFRDAVDITPHGHPDKLRHLNNLGIAFLTRFECIRKLSDLNDAITRIRDAVELTPHTHPDKPACLSNLGGTFLTCFACIGKLSDLEDATSTRIKDAVDLTPHSHPVKPAYLNNLGNAFRARFKCIGELSDLEDAIARHRDAVELTPRTHWHPDKSACLNNLGDAFLTRFEHIGELSDLEDAISRIRDAVELTPHTHLDKPGYLSNLGNAFLTRFKCIGELSDLKDAISRHRDAVDLTPHAHPDKLTRLSNLGSSFLTCFERIGELSDLEDAITRHRDAVDLTRILLMVTLSSRPILTTSAMPFELVFSVSGSSVISRTQFRGLGMLLTSFHMITLTSQSVLTTLATPFSFVLRVSGSSVISRMQFRGSRMLLISLLMDTLTSQVILVTLAAPFSLVLSASGSSVISRTQFRGTGMLLTSLHMVTLASRPVLTTLATPFSLVFITSGSSVISRDAITRHRDAVDLTPHGHPVKPAYLNNLGNAFRARFQHIGELNDLEDAISRHWDAGAIMRYRDAVELIPHTHPDKPACLDNLGSVFRARFACIGDLSNLEQAIFLCSCAASASTGSIRVRFQASKNWISFARQKPHHSLLQAYSAAISLLPELAWIGLSLSRRYDELGRAGDIVREAAAAALDSELPETAVEWLEQGRSVVWGELFQLRSSYEELSVAHPGHAHRLRENSATLEHASATREKSLVLSEQTSNATLPATESLKQKADNHRALAIERDKLLQEIRAFPGFEQFLLHKEFSQLRASAHSGPVVILNAAESRCDALIILADLDHVIHVPLLSFPFQRSMGLQNMLEKLLGYARVICFDDRKGDPAPLRGLEHIREIIRKSPSAQTILQESSVGTVEEVLDLLKQADWVHFACHGIQDPMNRTESGLCLADGRRLKVSDIIALSRPHGGLAFLSACQTAMGDEHLSDEAIHIAAGMLFAGYGGVIGTMWSISDQLAPEVASDVYTQLFRNGTRPNHREAARALHEAIGRLRERGDVPFHTWLPFIHVGL